MTTLIEPSWTPVPDGVWLALRHFIEPHTVGSFFVPGDPVPKGRPRIGKGGHAFTPKATKAGEKRVREAFREAMPDWVVEPDGTYGVLIEFRTGEGSLVDLDNATKLIWDALNGVFWEDDIQVGSSFLNLIRGADPGAEVLLFAMANNGTKLTRVCECGTRYRSEAPTCKPCATRRALVNELLRPSEDEVAAQLAGQKREVFSIIVRWTAGGGTSPTTAQIADAAGITEHRARQLVAALVTDGCVAREGRKLRIIGSLKGVAS